MTGVPDATPSAAAAITIDDPDDERIADYRALTDVELRTRWEPPHGLFIAEGELVLRRALRAGYPLRSILVDAQRVAASSRHRWPPRSTRPRRTCWSGPPASTCTAGCSPRSTARPLPGAAQVLARRHAGGDPGGCQQPHQPGRDLPGRRRAGHGRGAAVALLRRSALPAQRTGQHGRGVRGARTPGWSPGRRRWTRSARPASALLAMTPAAGALPIQAAGPGGTGTGRRCCSAPRGPGLSARRARRQRPAGGDSDAAGCRLAQRRRRGGRRVLGAGRSRYCEHRGISTGRCRVPERARRPGAGPGTQRVTPRGGRREPRWTGRCAGCTRPRYPTSPRCCAAASWC